MPRQKFFLNPQLAAPNVLTHPISRGQLAPAYAYVPGLQNAHPATEQVTLKAGANRISLSATRPNDWQSDIVWYSACDVESFAFFDELFARSGLADAVDPYVDRSERIYLYSGFFVVRQHCDEEVFHTDWVDARNDAFTAIIPLSQNASELSLRYRDIHGKSRGYEYRQEEAIAFGDNFYHCTAPGEAEAPVVLLSFTFGTDRMENWGSIATTAAAQGRLHRRPDGQFIRDGRPLD